METNFNKPNPKKILGYLMALVMVFFTNSTFAQCDHTLTMMDSYGDGWNGASVDVSVNGAIVASGSCTALSEDLVFSASDGDAINLSWFSGSYDSEISFDLKDGAGTSIATGFWGDDPAATAACGSVTPCANDEVTVTLYDSYGDGGGQITVDGNVLANTGASNSMVVCVDLSGCVDVTYASTDSWSSENSWDVVDASGAVIASGADASGFIGTCGTPGCMDATACNYDAAATLDDGSCTYAATGFDCAGNCLSGDAVVYTAGSYASENSFTITDCAGTVLAEMTSGTSGFEQCITLPAVYSVNLVDSYGDSWNGGSLSVAGVSYTLDGIADDGVSSSFNLGSCPVYGCTDTTAANYDPLADTDDGSCTYGVPGCTDATACNYDSTATADDGSCTFAVTGYDCSGNCLSGSEVTLTMTDSYGDGGGSVTINGTTYTCTGSSDSWTFCMDVSVCTDITYAATDSWPYENGWSLSDASGVLASSDCAGVFGCTPESGIIGNTPGFDCAGLCLTGDLVTVTLYDSYGDGGGEITVDGNVLTNTGTSNSMSICVDLSVCTDIIYASTDIWSSENSWDVVDASGAVIASGADASGNVGACAVFGCTDPAASNYDPAANTDDGSCITCSDNWVTITVGGGFYESEVSWTLLASDGSTVTAGTAPYSMDMCLPNDCYTLDMVDSWGDGWNNCIFDITMSGSSVTGGGITLASGSTGTADIELGAMCAVYGCTDVTATNYDAAANTDDGSCQYSCTAAPYFENFDLGSGTSNQGGWILNSFGTTSTGTGPTDDMTGGGNYMYYETSGLTVGSPAITLTSECLDISTLASACLSFNYHMFGGTIGTLSAIVNGDTVWTLSGDQGNQWNWAQVDLSAYASVDVTLEFVAEYGGSFSGDIAIDNIGVDECIVIAGCTDPGALNYDATANVDDGSCNYCTGSFVTVSFYDSWGDGWNGATMMVTDYATGDSITSGTLGGGSFYTDDICLVDGCYQVVVGGGSYDSEITFDFGTLVGASTGTYLVSVGTATCPILGCTDPTALNYDSIANTDDGSCILLCDLYVLTATVDAVPSCNGAADGAATVSAPATVDTLNTSNTFLWDDGQTTSTATGLAAGTYTCTVTDATSGCSSSISVTIDVTPVIVPNTTASAATVGQTNGSMDANASGGTPCYNGTAASLDGGAAVTTQWASNVFDVVASSDLQITSIDQPTNAGMGTLDVYYRLGSAQGYEADANGWMLAGSAVVMANVGGDLTNVPVSISVNSGETVSIYVHGTLSSGIACALFGSGVDSTYNAVAASDANLSIMSGFATGGAPGSGTTYPSASSYDFSGLVNYSLSSYTYYWMDLTTGASSNASSITGLGVGPVALTVTDCNGCSVSDTIFGIEMDVYGCTDATAANYNASANIEDGSCDYNGCTDVLATNYDTIATIDDGSCVYSCAYYSYDDELTITLTPDWYTSEISWTLLDANLDTVLTSAAYANGGAVDIQTVCAMNGCYFINGYDSYGDGWGGGTLDITDGAGNTLASMSLSASTFESSLFSVGGAACTAGCTDSLAANYDVTATVDDGSCLDTIYGCTDPLASNTTPYANIDDGSCVYCIGTYANITVGGGSWQTEVSWSLLASDGTTVAAGGAPFASDVCLPDDCYTLIMVDSYGDGWNGNMFDVSDAGVLVTSETLATGDTGIVEFSVGAGACVVLGCTDPGAINYDPAANTDDGSCAYTCTAAPYSENFDAGTGTWTVNGWFLNAGGTISGGTGPSDDITGGGNYMYYETSTGYFPTVSMTSECLDMSGLTDPCLSFNYHMYGATTGSLDAIVNGDTVWSLSGDQGNQWNIAQVSLSAYAGVSVTVEFVAAYGGGFTGDIAIDEVSVDECVFIPTYGCLDTLAYNYDPAADTDDGSCVYPCNDNLVDMNMYDSFGDGWNGAVYTVTDATGNVVATNGLATGAFFLDSLCLVDGCYIITVGGGSYDSEITFDFASLLGQPAGTYPVTIGSATCIPGCTDATAQNYDPTATIDDGSCNYCTDNAVSMVTTDAYGLGWGWTYGYAATWTITDLNDSTNTFSGPANTGVNVSVGGVETYDLCLIDGCYEVATTNIYSTYDASLTWDLAGTTGAVNVTSYIAIGAATCPVMGCTDPTANNYDPAATMDDGSCTYACLLDEVSLNLFDSWGDGWNGGIMTVNGVDYTIATGSVDSFTICIDLSGCTDLIYTAGSYSSENSWNVTDASGAVLASGPNASGQVGAACPVYGCTDSTAANYDPAADTDDGSCDYLGCTNPSATNYDANATIDDGSCTFGCSDNTVNVSAGGGSYDSEISWDILDGSGNVVASGAAGSVTTLCIVDDCYTVNMYDSYGDGWNGATITLDDGAGTVLATDGLASGSSGSFDIALGSAVCAVYGCTDPLATNYDASANTDDGSCSYSGCTDPAADNYDANATTDDGSCIYPCSYYGLDEITVTLYDSYGDGGGQITVDGNVLTNTGSSNSMTICVDLSTCVDITYASTDSWSYENSWDVVDASGAVLASGADASGTAGVCAVLGCIDMTACNYDASANTDDGSCTYAAMYYDCAGNCLLDTDGDGICDENEIPGCTDPAAFNYDANATDDDGSCVPVTLGCTDPAADNYFAGANTDDGSCIYAGCTDPAADNYDATATVDDGSCTYTTISGCTDPAADNYDATATTDDGSCTYPICDAKPTGLNVWDITDTRFRLGWDNMNTANCMVWKYNVRYRETGTTTWTTRSAGAGNGLCNFGLNNVEKLMINFNPNTTYDIRMRVLYCGADPATGWTGWTSTINVTLGDYCPDLANVTVQTFNGQQNKARFDWDTTGVYEFARLYTRVNVLGSPWTVQGGFGIYYPTFFKNIFTFTPGETYRVQANSFCSASLASYRGNLTPPVVWTQPGGSSKIEGGIAINNLDVYPNPSRDAFNVTFTSDDVQNLEVRVLNIVGEVVYTENLEQFVGEYTKAIDLATYTKGVYFLEITTNDGVVNKKLILQ